MLLLLSGIIYLSGCSKTASSPVPVSIVGTWTITGARVQHLVQAASIFDTTFSLPGGEGVFSFTTNGYYTFLSPGHSQTGGYLLNANTLSLFDTTVHPPTWDQFTISSLTQNNMTLSTSYTTADTTTINSEILTR
jgi:hypothetical protein